MSTRVITAQPKNVLDPVNAIQVAHEVAERVAEVARQRETLRHGFPEEVELLRGSGLLAATVPRRLGGPELPVATIAEIFRILATADGSFAQIPQSHFTFTRWLFNGEHPELEEEWATRLLSGTLVANAQAETRGITYAHPNPTGSGGEVLAGAKYFCTGSIYADYLIITARRPGEETPTIGVFLPADTPGIQIKDDWDALGQRLTGSGTVVLDEVPFTARDTYSFNRALDLPGYGAFAQLLHTAIDVGLLSAALDEIFTRLRAGHRGEATMETAADTLTFHLAGELQAQRYAAEAVLGRAAAGVDKLWAGQLGAGGLRARRGCGEDTAQ